MHDVAKKQSHSNISRFVYTFMCVFAQFQLVSSLVVLRISWVFLFFFYFSSVFSDACVCGILFFAYSFFMNFKFFSVSLLSVLPSIQSYCVCKFFFVFFFSILPIKLFSIHAVVLVKSIRLNSVAHRLIYVHVGWLILFFIRTCLLCSESFQWKLSYPASCLWRLYYLFYCV